MIYDEYLNLTGENIVPFVDQDEPERRVYRLKYSLMNKQDGYLILWIQNEKDAFYLHMLVEEHEEWDCAYMMNTYFYVMNGVKNYYKVELMRKFGRASQRMYYTAGIKASLYAKEVVSNIYPDQQVDWKSGISRQQLMSVKYIEQWQDLIVQERDYVIKELKHAV